MSEVLYREFFLSGMQLRLGSNRDILQGSIQKIMQKKRNKKDWRVKERMTLKRNGKVNNRDLLLIGMIQHSTLIR